MDLDTALDQLLVDDYSNSKSRILTSNVVYGSYEINGYQYILLHVKDKQVIKERHREEYEDDRRWNTVRENLLDLARTINTDNAKAKTPVDFDTLPFVFYDDCPEDPKFSILEFSLIEAWGQPAFLPTLRRAIKTTFGNYRIQTFCETLTNDSFYNALTCYTEKDQLTRRKLTVKVLKQELTYHMLIGQFRTKTQNDTDK